MAKTFGSRTLSISINCHSAKVYEFVSNPANLPKWAMAFCKSVTKSNDGWIMDTPGGSMKVRFGSLCESKPRDRGLRSHAGSTERFRK